MNQPALTPKVVLGIAAHPDDMDFYAGGTMAAFAKQGADVYYLILTDGGKGTEDRTMISGALRDTRQEEQRTAGKLLGLKDVFFFDYPDGTLENTHTVKRDIVKVIRQVKPDVVVTLDPSVLYSAEQHLINHPDHRAAGQAALDAVYPLARDHMSFPELLADGYEPHKTKTVLLIRLTPEDTAFAIDITSTLEVKLQAIAAHASQFDDLEDTKSLLRAYAAEAGKPHDLALAEPFVRIDIA
ncbi:MAG TPA: PIG-L deacetylase family protein [Magnetospirillaceae bacterium]|nr:PIG-L deacetylase family protein [Magnetospirillaceae bacterium]